MFCIFLQVRAKGATLMKQLTDSAQLSRLVLKGFKSIAACDLELGSLNILIGPNGAGKSNFVEFFRMIQQILEGNLQLYVSRMPYCTSDVKKQEKSKRSSILAITVISVHWNPQKITV
jgi:AAA15 family ATPase/GTPase